MVLTTSFPTRPSSYFLAARPPEGQGGVDLVLDLDQRVQDHRRAVVHVDLVGVETRVAALVGIPPVDLERLDQRGPGRRLVGRSDVHTSESQSQMRITYAVY